MAVVTERPIDLHDGVFFVEVIYDDVTGDLTSVRAVNTDPVRSYTFQTRRGNGQLWRDVTASPGFDQTFNAGGPVRNIDDIPEWRAGDA